MTENAPTASNTPRIRWHEVIELDPTLSASDRTKMVAALETIEKSNIGQAKFAEARAIQSVTPPDGHTRPLRMEGVSAEELKQLDASNPSTIAASSLPKYLLLLSGLRPAIT